MKPGDTRSGESKQDRTQLERDVRDEIRFHIEERTARLIEEGLGPQEAREEAERRFGAVPGITSECLSLTARRERRRGRSLFAAELAQDLRLALRGLRRSPGFAAIAILTLALGIGGNTAIFSIFDAVLLRSLPYRNSDELVKVWGKSQAELSGLRRAASFKEIAALESGQDLTLTGSDEAARLRGVRVTPNLFSTLGVRPQRGRTFSEEEGRVDGEPVVLLSHHLWQVRFGAAENMVGRKITLSGRPHTVIGIAPGHFRFPDEMTDLWLPLAIDDSNQGAYWGNYNFEFIGRLTPGVDLPAATAEVGRIAERLRLENPVWTPVESYSQNVSLSPLQVNMAGDLGQLLELLLAAVMVVLVIVCVNLANLLLARSSVRGKETAIRASLGASRSRLIMLHLSESFLLAIPGCGLGLLLSALLLAWFLPLLPGADSRFGQIHIDGRVLAFSIALTLVTTLAFGLLPAVRISRDHSKSLVTAGREERAGPSRSLRNGLVVVQVALAVVLVAGSGLLLRSFWELWKVQPGFEGEKVLSARLDPAEGFYEDPAKRHDFYSRLRARLLSLPGVEAVSAVDRLPLDGFHGQMAHRVRGQEFGTGNLPMAYTEIVTSDYFRTMGISLLDGRDFSPADGPRSSPSVIVNRALAESMWPGKSAVGEAVGYPWPSDWLNIVGVVENVLLSDLDSEIESTIYFHYPQRTLASMTVLVRTPLQPLSLAPQLRSIVKELDPQIPVNDVRTVEAVAWNSIAKPRFVAALLTGFASVALLLGALGIYGVIAYLVAQRRREIGIRMALGASPRGILYRVVRQGLLLTSIGIGVGLLGAGLSSQWFEHLLFNVSSFDAGIFAASALLLAAVAIVASYWPARRAARLDPLETLRAE